MSASAPVLKVITTSYTPGEVLAMMTIAMVVALLLIALGFRLIRTMSAIRRYDAACDKVKAIEARLDGMNQLHSKECFDFQQIIFERNNEILELKSKLLKFNMNSPL